MKLIRYKDYYNLMKTLVKKPIIIILNIEMNLNEFKFVGKKDWEIKNYKKHL